MRNWIMSYVDSAVFSILRRVVKDKTRLTRLEDTYYTKTFWLLP